jgi:hypothetical protein
MCLKPVAGFWFSRTFERLFAKFAASSLKRDPLTFICFFPQTRSVDIYFFVGQAKQ